MLKIRLQRTGRINEASYRLVVVEHARSTKTGSIVERVGSYNPHTKVRTLNTERINYWLSKGAQASGTVHNMLVSAGVVKGKKINVLPKRTVAVVAAPEVATPETTVETAPAAESPAEPEVKEEKVEATA